MPYRTRLVLTSGDRRALDAAVGSLRTIAESKGAEVAGPHTRPSRTVSVPLYKAADGAARFGTWDYEVFERELVVTGHDTVARALAGERLPSSVNLSVTIDHVTPAGGNR